MIKLSTHFGNKILTDLVDTIKGGKKVGKPVERLVELAGRSKGYTSQIATTNNTRDSILQSITNQIEKVNKISADDAVKKAALDEMWTDYTKMQEAPDGIFGRKTDDDWYGNNKVSIDDVVEGDAADGITRTKIRPLI